MSETKLCLSCSASSVLNALITEYAVGEDMEILPYLVLSITRDIKRDERRRFVLRGERIEVKEAS